ncbi:MAG: hypothetical protein KF881_01635 [Acidobacteria bacterium]|nr:hypothetical protein [Acidobacteriota bacterium]
MLPKKNDLITNGGVYRQMVRCGKANCRCTKGQMHEAHYFITRRYGRQRKLYIPKAKLEEVLEAVRESRRYRANNRNLMRRSIELLRISREQLRQFKEQNFGHPEEF